MFRKQYSIRQTQRERVERTKNWGEMSKIQPQSKNCKAYQRLMLTLASSNSARSSLGTVRTETSGENSEKLFGEERFWLNSENKIVELILVTTSKFSTLKFCCRCLLEG